MPTAFLYKNEYKSHFVISHDNVNKQACSYGLSQVSVNKILQL